MSVRGRPNWDFDFRTFCDFGEPSRKTELARHYSPEAAERSFKKLRRVYSRFGRFHDRHMWRCWQEDRQGNIIRDTGDMWAPVKA